MRMYPINQFRGAYFFLSNFAPAIVVYEGITYPTAEHAYQASKTIYSSMREGIAAQPTPAEAKVLGNQIALRFDWDDQLALKIMEDIVRAKFEDDALAQKLIETSPSELIEGNSWGDTFWGQCNGQGENHLGKILMKIRLECRQRLIQ